MSSITSIFFHQKIFKPSHITLGYVSGPNLCRRLATKSKNHERHSSCHCVVCVLQWWWWYEVMVLARAVMPASSSQLPDHWYSGSQANKAHHLSSGIPSICIILFLIFSVHPWWPLHPRSDDYMWEKRKEEGWGMSIAWCIIWTLLCMLKNI